MGGGSVCGMDGCVWVWGESGMMFGDYVGGY